MYLYFDVNGNLREVINYPVREHSENVNKIYIYVEKVNEPVDGTYHLPSEFTGAKINFKLLDTDVNLNDTPVVMSKVTINEIPYDPKRDLKWFKYGYKYEMWTADANTSQSGVVSATAYLFNITQQLALNTFNYNVEYSVGVLPDSTMSESQYSYLYNNLSNRVPYTGATSNVNLGSYIISANEFNIGTLGDHAGMHKMTDSDDIRIENPFGNIVFSVDGDVYLGLVAEGNAVARKSDVKMYRHTIRIVKTEDENELTLVYLDRNSEQINDFIKLRSRVYKSLGAVYEGLAKFIFDYDVMISTSSKLELNIQMNFILQIEYIHEYGLNNTSWLVSDLTITDIVVEA